MPERKHSQRVTSSLNPIEDRKRDNGIPTFGEKADSVREALSAGFRNEKHKAQWKSTLETHAAPLRAKKPPPTAYLSAAPLPQRAAPSKPHIPAFPDEAERLWAFPLATSGYCPRPPR